MCFAFFKSWNSRLILLPISIQILIPPISKFEIDEQLGVQVTSWKSFVQKILVLLVLVLIHAVLFCGFGEFPLVQLPNPIRIRTHVFLLMHTFGVRVTSWTFVDNILVVLKVHAAEFCEIGVMFVQEVK